MSASDSSIDLVRNVIDEVKVPDVGIGISGEREILMNLKNTVIEMCNNGPAAQYTKSLLSQQVKLNCGDDENLYDGFVQGISDDLDENSLKVYILNLRFALNNHFREQQIGNILNKASYIFNRKRDSIKDTNQFVAEILAQLEPLQMASEIKDPATIGEVDLEDENAIQTVFKQIKDMSSNEGILTLGWHELNDMTQGGLRRGETIVLNALQHKYKTGFSLSVFKQVALYNRPYLFDRTKKPLLLRISFEDNLTNNIQFLYQSLRADEIRIELGGGLTDEIDGIIRERLKQEVSNEEMAAYVKRRMTATGFKLKMIRVDPTQWTYKHICNKVIELEAQGYEIVGLFLDYLGMIPTTGCISTGPIGTDMRDLFRRMRNFCSSKNITLFTPHQMSTDAKQLIRGGLPEDQLVKDVAEKGYYAGSRQLDQEIDLEIYIHLFKHNKETYLAVQRGKHRLPNIIPDEMKYFLFKFPKGLPIPDNIHIENHRPMRKLPSPASNVSQSVFDF